MHFGSGLHYLENHLGWIFVAMLMTVFAGMAFFAVWSANLGGIRRKGYAARDGRFSLVSKRWKGLIANLAISTKSKLNAKHKARHFSCAC